MSDLSASHCGCNQTISTNDGCGCGFNNNWIWIIILLFCCGGCGNSFGFSNNRCDCDNGCNNNSCIWIIILLFFCCGNNNGCC